MEILIVFIDFFFLCFHHIYQNLQVIKEYLTSLISVHVQHMVYFYQEARWQSYDEEAHNAHNKSLCL